VLRGYFFPAEGEKQMESHLTSGTRLFTVGHSNYEAEVLLTLLEGAGVTALADVRSSPYSRRLPHFSRGPLEALLRSKGIAYVFLGRELGGRPADPALYDPEGWADYERIRATATFREGLQRLVRGLERYRIALLCGEEDPLDCHRGLMIAPALVELGLAPVHIRRDGRLETTAEMEARLQEATGLGGLFAESLAEAYRVMNRKKAFRLERDEDEARF
jgi:uncharacterized protein (DUF488 family)